MVHRQSRTVKVISQPCAYYYMRGLRRDGAKKSQQHYAGHPAEAFEFCQRLEEKNVALLSSS